MDGRVHVGVAREWDEAEDTNLKKMDSTRGLIREVHSKPEEWDNDDDNDDDNDRDRFDETVVMAAMMHVMVKWS